MCSHNMQRGKQRQACIQLTNCCLRALVYWGSLRNKEWMFMSLQNSCPLENYTCPFFTSTNYNQSTSDHPALSWCSMQEQEENFIVWCNNYPVLHSVSQLIPVFLGFRGLYISISASHLVFSAKLLWFPGSSETQDISALQTGLEDNLSLYRESQEIYSSVRK